MQISTSLDVRQAKLDRKIRSKALQRRAANAFGWTGKKYGKPIGVHVDDNVQLRRAIWLCETCWRQFDRMAKKAHYFHETKIWVQGNCDVCKEFDPASHLFVPDEHLGEMSSNRGVGSWAPYGQFP